jgi:hypothetical protein
MPDSWEPRIGKLEKALEKLGPKVTALEERAKIWAKILGFAAFVLIGVLSWGGVQLFTLNGSVSKLTGQVSSMTPRAISELFATDTSNKETIARNAQLAAALVASARNSSLRSNKKELAVSGLRLSQLVTRHSDVPELWQASSQLASYRSELENSISVNLPDCKDVSPKQRSNWEEMLKRQAAGIPYPGTHTVTITPYIYSNCRQDMNDFDDLIKKNPHLEVQPKDSSPGGVVTAPYIFESSLIIYNGERPLPDTVLEFKNCVFQMELKQEPLERSQKLIMALLTSDVNDVRLPTS